LGIVILAFSLSMFAIYLPEHGGMLFRAGELGKYNPQLIKPPTDLRGSDQLEYDTNNKTGPDGHNKVMPIGRVSSQVTQVPTSASVVTEFDPRTGAYIKKGRFHPETGQEHPKFDPETGAQNW